MKIKKTYFIVRFGGDEFIIIGHIKSEEELNTSLEMLNNSQEQFNKESSLYKLSLSIGYRIYDNSSNISIDQIISEADKEMYIIKNSSR